MLIFVGGFVKGRDAGDAEDTRDARDTRDRGCTGCMECCWKVRRLKVGKLECRDTGETIDAGDATNY
jgi:hypothetical protein